MKVSVIIPTYNGAKKILKALGSLDKQTRLPEEVIVVIDGSTDETEHLLRHAAFSYTMRVITQENGGRADVRNRGVKEANNELMIFMDDDMIVNPAWVQTHFDHHQKYPGSLMTGKFEDPYLDSDDEFWLFVHWLDRSWMKTVGSDQAAATRKLEHPYLSAANFSIKKDIFLALGGFDKRLNDAEDFDLATSAMRAGFPIYFSEEAVGIHDDSGVASFPNYIKRLRKYNDAQRMLVSLKPAVYPNLLPTNKFGFFKRAAFRIFANRFWITSLGSTHWKILPADIRFKLYDVIITANCVVFPQKVPL